MGTKLSIINREKEGKAAPKPRRCCSGLERDGVEDTHAFLIPCLGWKPRLPRGRFFSLLVFGLRGKLGA